MNVSAIHGLILIHGDEDTGFEHIRLRHEIYSPKTYWKVGENDSLKLDYPSKFSPKSIPIFDYVLLADAMCRVDFINIEGNKAPAATSDTLAAATKRLRQRGRVCSAAKRGGVLVTIPQCSWFVPANQFV